MYEYEMIVVCDIVCTVCTVHTYVTSYIYIHSSFTTFTQHLILLILINVATNLVSDTDTDTLILLINIIALSVSCVVCRLA